jgi:hypothetical protein
MPRKDSHHDIVVRALKKAGWEILEENHYLAVGSSPMDAKRLYIDIRAQHKIQALVVLIEIKDLEDSPVHEFMEALGQFLVYKSALKIHGDTTPLYIAIPEKAYKTIMQSPLVHETLTNVLIPLALLIYNPEKEELIQWIPQP